VHRAGSRDDHNWPTDFPLVETQRRQDNAFVWWLHDRFDIVDFDAGPAGTLYAVYRRN
jgi:hypothetical protein